MYFTNIIWVICFGDIAFGMTVTFEPNKAALFDSVTITCKRSTGSSATITWAVDSAPLTTCDDTTNDNCIPSPTGYTFSTDVAVNEFNLSLASTSITDCRTYTCTDAITTIYTVSEKMYLGYWDKNEVTNTEPEPNTSGSISITTGCVLSPDDLTITWFKIVNGISVALSTGDPSPVTSTNRSTCTRTCHSEEDKKATSGFTHTEYTGTDSVTVQYMVTVSHSSYPDNADIYNWTSAIYTFKQGASFSGDTDGLSTGAIVGIVIGSVVCVIIIIVVILAITGRLPGYYFSLSNITLRDKANKEKHASEKQHQHDDQAHQNLLENEEKRPGRHEPPPPAGANPSREGSGSVVSGRDVDMHETDTSLNRSQLPNIHTPGHDNKGRGLSANFGDDDHPLVAINIPAQKAGALPTIVDTPRETKKKAKKKKKDKQEDNQNTETVLDF